MTEKNKGKEQEVEAGKKPEAAKPEQPETKSEETNQEEKPETKKPEEKKADPEQAKTKGSNDQINPDKIKAGMTVRVHQKIRDVNAKGEEKERIQVFEGMVLAKRGKRLEEARILVRKIAANHIGVEKLFPLASPTIVKVEIVRESKVRRAKLYFLRNYKKKLKEKKVA